MKNFNKLAMIVVLGSGFAIAQSSMPQSSTPQSTSPSATAPSATQSTPATTDQQPSSTLPNTDQKPTTDDTAKPADSSKLPQSDAAPAAAPAASGDVQGNIQSAIQKDPSLANANVTVNVNAGKSVDLTGTVPTKDAKDAAERIAKENAGSLKVKNHLKVSGGDNSSMPKTDANPSPKL